MSYANGCMKVVLPEEHIGEFERFFDQDSEYSFLNTEITLTDSAPSGKSGYKFRAYDISCKTSVAECLLNTDSCNLRDVCKKLSVALLSVDTENDKERINESVRYDKGYGRCTYTSVSLLDYDISYERKEKSEAEAE